MGRIMTETSHRGDHNKDN